MLLALFALLALGATPALALLPPGTTLCQQYAGLAFGNATGFEAQTAWARLAVDRITDGCTEDACPGFAFPGVFALTGPVSLLAAPYTTNGTLGDEVQSRLTSFFGAELGCSA
ncbi:MAG: hypothetical protein Q7V62_17060, partial [Actinomycetota bacterium]|nr:hypothetical protein [Actinomycetota bacterium]